MPNSSKTKVGFLKRLKRIVASHIYDLGNKVLNEGIENAKDEHDVTIPTDKGIKQIIKEALDTNKNVIKDLKATKSEMTALFKDASKQAIAALKNDKEELTSEEDRFLASLDIDLDDFDDEELEDIMDGDFEDDSEETSFESMTDSYVGTDLDAISAGVLLLIRTACNKNEQLLNVFNSNIDNITNIINGLDKEPEDNRELRRDKLEIAKDLMKNISSDVTSNSVGLEDDLVLPEIIGENDDMDEDIDSETVMVVEVIPTEVPIREKTEDIELKAKTVEVIDKFLKNAENVVNKDPKIQSELNIIDNKLEAVARYLASVSDLDENFIHHCFISSLPKPWNVAMAFYFNLLPEDIITAGKRILAVYNKIN